MVELMELIRTYFVEFLAITGLSGASIAGAISIFKAIFSDKKVVNRLSHKIDTAIETKLNDIQNNYLTKINDLVEQNQLLQQGLNVVNEAIKNNTSIEFQAFIDTVLSQDKTLALKYEQIKSELIAYANNQAQEAISQNKDEIIEKLDTANEIVNTVETTTAKVAKKAKRLIKKAKKRVNQATEVA